MVPLLRLKTLFPCAVAIILTIATTCAHAQSPTYTRHAYSPKHRTASRAKRVARARTCPNDAVERPVVARYARALRVGPVRNRFGRGAFGIATGGGVQTESRRQMSSELNAYHEAGARWLRIDINWASIQANGPSSFAWGATDRVIRKARRCGLNVLGVIYYTPSWARPRGTVPNWAPSPGAYGRFASQAARHYRRRGVSTFEIWNEPNIADSFAPSASPRAYTAMLRAADIGIKRANPSATVVTGGLAPSPSGGGGVSPVSFLRGIYAQGGEPYFDAVGAHPYCSPAYPGSRKAWSAWYQLYGTRTSLRSLMTRHGDGAKKIWATEFGAPTSGPPGTFVSLRTQAAMVTRAYQLWSSYSWAGPLFTYSGRDTGIDRSSNQDFYGLLNYNFTAKPAFDAYRNVSHALAIAARRIRPVG